MWTKLNNCTHLVSWSTLAITVICELINCYTIGGHTCRPNNLIKKLFIFIYNNHNITGIHTHMANKNTT